MAQRRFHYEQAFEHYLRANRVPYIAVDEAKKALPPPAGSPGLKSFDFVVYPQGEGANLLVDIKGRQYGSGKNNGKWMSNRRLESWVTREDVEGLEKWQVLFGKGFKAVFVFAYCLQQQPPDALFEEVFSFGDRWYMLREVELTAYRERMVERSAKWGTVHIRREDFGEISRAFSVRGKRREWKGEEGCRVGSGGVSCGV